LAIGIGVSLLLELRDKTLRTESDVEQFLGLTTLAMIPIIVESKGNQNPAARPRAEAGARVSETAHV